MGKEWSLWLRCVSPATPPSSCPCLISQGFELYCVDSGWSVDLYCLVKSPAPPHTCLANQDNLHLDRTGMAVLEGKYSTPKVIN